MKLYDFSLYKKLRDERLSAEHVQEMKQHLSDPGAAAELKKRVSNWLVLHQQVLRKRAS